MFENAEDTTWEEMPLYGIKGWLILPAVGLGIAAISSVILIIFNLKFILISGFIESQSITYISYAFINIITFIQFVRKARDAPRIIITVILLTIILNFMGAFPGQIPGQIWPSVIGATIQASIWIPYFMFSKRVKVTFIN